MPDRNESDIEEIPEDVRKELEIVPAARISDVLNAVLEPAQSETAEKKYAIQGADAQSDPAGDRLVAKET